MGFVPPFTRKAHLFLKLLQQANKGMIIIYMNMFLSFSFICHHCFSEVKELKIQRSFLRFRPGKLECHVFWGNCYEAFSAVVFLRSQDPYIDNNSQKISLRLKQRICGYNEYEFYQENGAPSSALCSLSEETPSERTFFYNICGSFMKTKTATNFIHPNCSKKWPIFIVNRFSESLKQTTANLYYEKKIFNSSKGGFSPVRPPIITAWCVNTTDVPTDTINIIIN